MNIHVRSSKYKPDKTINLQTTCDAKFFHDHGSDKGMGDMIFSKGEKRKIASWYAMK